MPITPRKCKAAALATAPVAAALGAYGFLKGATKFYSSQVNGTPEQYKMTLPGDDLVPEGSPRFKRLTHVEDLDAPLRRGLEARLPAQHHDRRLLLLHLLREDVRTVGRQHLHGGTGLAGPGLLQAR